MQNGKTYANGKTTNGPISNGGRTNTSQLDRRGFFVESRAIRIGPPMEIHVVRWSGYDDPSVKLRITEHDGQEPIELAIRFDGEWEAFLNGENDFIDNIRGTKIFCDAVKKTIAVRNLPRGELVIQLSDTEIGRSFQLANELDAVRVVLVAERKERLDAKAKTEAEAAAKKRAEEEARLAKAKADAEAAELARKAKEEAEKKAAEEAELAKLIAEEEAAKANHASPAASTEPAAKEVDDAVTDEVPATADATATT